MRRIAPNWLIGILFPGRTMTIGDVTRLLEAAGSGDRGAFDALYRSVYDELHRMAQANMRREKGGHTLQPTALVNEAYLRLAAATASWEDRRHFFGAAAEAMRRILVDHARRRLANKRGADFERVTLTGPALEIAAPERRSSMCCNSMTSSTQLQVESPGSPTS